MKGAYFLLSVYAQLSYFGVMLIQPYHTLTMSKQFGKIAKISHRLARLEHKINHLITIVSAIRLTLTPRQSELDDVIYRLHQTAESLRKQSQREYQRYVRQDTNTHDHDI